MPKPLVILGKSFSSQKEAEELFYGIRDRNLLEGKDISAALEFSFLEGLYLKYCEYTYWPLPGAPVSFYARNIARGSGSDGGTTQGFVVKFDNGTEDEFSARKAIRAVANRS